MTHYGPEPLPDRDPTPPLEAKGEYTADEWKHCTGDYRCRKCQSFDVWYRMWESSDGAHEDTHYRCKNCGHEWWIDGIDY